MAVFSDLPMEIRDAIWKFCLPDENNPEPGILFVKAEHVLAGDRSYFREPNVEMPLSRIMHLCHESRNFAKKHLPFQGPYDELPCRPFQPEIDTFYMRTYGDSRQALDILSREAKERAGEGNDTPLLRTIVHFATDYFQLFNGGTYQYMLKQMTCLRDLTVVLDDTELDWCEDELLGLVPCSNDDDPENVWTDSAGTRVPIGFTIDDVRNMINSDVEPDDDSPWNRDTGEPLFDITCSRVVCRKDVL